MILAVELAGYEAHMRLFFSRRFLMKVLAPAALVLSQPISGQARETSEPHPKTWQIRELLYEDYKQWLEKLPIDTVPTEQRSSEIVVRTGNKLSNKKTIGSGTAPKWGPKGEQVAFLSLCKRGLDWCRQLGVMNADGSDRKMLTGVPPEHPGPNWRPDSWVRAFTWSPTESKIAYVEETTSSIESTKIVTIRADGTDRKVMANLGKLNCLEGEKAPRWSPDGQFIAFNACVNGERIIFIEDSEGQNARPLVRGYDATWSPDGRRLVFLNRSGQKDSDFFIFTVSPDGTNLNLVFKDRFEPDILAWVPGGTSIAFTSSREGKDRLGLFNIRLDGSNFHKLIVPRGWRLSYCVPNFSPDGTKVVVAVSDMWQTNLMLVDLSTNRQQVIGPSGLIGLIQVQWELR